MTCATTTICHFSLIDKFFPYKFTPSFPPFPFPSNATMGGEPPRSPGGGGQVSTHPDRTTTQSASACNKTSLLSAFRPAEALRDLYQKRILNYISTIDVLAQHATLFLKFYLLNTSFPIVSKNDYYAILYLLNKGSLWNPKDVGKQNFATLKTTYETHVQDYVELVGFTRPNIRCEQQGINYLSKSLNTNLTVNVKEHFVKNVLRYVNLRLGEFVLLIVYRHSDMICDILTLFCLKA